MCFQHNWLSAATCVNLNLILQYLAGVHCRHSRPTSFTVSHSTSLDCTTLPAQLFRSLALLCRRSDSLELTTGQSPWPVTHQQQLQAITEDESISTLPLSTHSAVEMLHDSALYKSIIDNDIAHRLLTVWSIRCVGLPQQA